MGAMLFWLGIAQVIALGVAILVVILCIGAIVRAISIPADVARTASCGGCGHEITDVSPGRCPECGAFLLKVGVITPRLVVQHRGGLLGAVIGWTILVALGGVVATWIVMMVASTTISGAQRMQYSGTNTFSPQQSFNPQTGSVSATQQYTLTITVDVVINEFGQPESGEIVATTNGRNIETTSIALDVATTDYTIDKDGEEIRTGASDDLVEAVRVMYETSGLDVDDEQVITQMMQVVDMLDQALIDPQSYQVVIWNTPTSGGLTSTGGGSSSSSLAMGGAIPAAPFAVIGSIAAVYVGGLVFIVMRRRKLVSRLQTPA